MEDACQVQELGDDSPCRGLPTCLAAYLGEISRKILGSSLSSWLVRTFAPSSLPRQGVFVFVIVLFCETLKWGMPEPLRYGVILRRAALALCVPPLVCI